MLKLRTILWALLLPATALLGQPIAPTPGQLATLRARSALEPSRAAASTPLSLNVSSREEVRQFYRGIYAASDDVPMGWTGSYTTGAAGDTLAAYKEAVALRINFFRALVGVPAAVSLSPTFSAKAQQAALMMSANQALSHFPPNSWTFFTADGAEAAANSNIALGNAGPDAVTAYMNDNGGNNAAVGHRRWIIYPQTRTMGTGDVPGNGASLLPANAVWIFDDLFGTARPATRTTAVTYPPAGYVPHTLVWPRWSFSHPGASFTNATVSMTRNGQAISAAPEPLSTGAGEPTFVWVYDGQDTDAGLAHARPLADTTYTVSLSNVVIGGASQNFTYNVTVFDPDVAGGDFLPVTVTGPAAPSVGAANPYSAAKPLFAGSFDWRTLQFSAFAKTYGAEAGLDGLVAATSAGYSVVTSGSAAAGSSSYHLAHPVTASQTLTLPETFFVGTTSPAVAFSSRLGWATTNQVARVQVSTDDGRAWTDVYAQSGSGGQGEGSFVSRSAPLTAFSGRTIRVRFNYTVAGNRFPQTDNDVGWLLDQVTLTGVQAVTAGTANSVSSGNGFAYTPGSAGTAGLQARGVLFDAYPLEWGPVAQVTAVAGATFTTQPASQAAGAGGAATLSVAATGATGFQWQRNGVALAGATNSSLAISNLQPANTGLYTAATTGGGGSATSNPAIVGISSTDKVIGTGSEIGFNIAHPNTNIFDQILAHGAAVSFTADAGQVTRLSYIDLNDDIVQVEFAGAGTVSITFAGSSGPGNPTKYNQDLIGAGFPGYIKGHAGIVVTGANETTNLSIFTVGRATAFDPTGGYNILLGPGPANVPANNGSSLFAGHGATSYDGMADVAFVAIASTNGKFGGLRSANASYWATAGPTGVFAPGVEFTGPVFVGDINGMGSDASPRLQIGGTSGDNRTWITGGDLKQDNGRAVQVSGLTQLHFRDGSDSHGTIFAAKVNQGQLEDNGVNVTSLIVVNP
jgi:hypothetical protein